jgi:hypothetical protein
MSLALLPALLLFAGSEPEPITCYDVALLGTLRLADEGYRISVSKVYEGGWAPRSIPVLMDNEWGIYPSIPHHRNAVFYLVRLKDGYFGVVTTAGGQKVDGRGLLTRAHVDKLTRERKLERCPAAS